METVVIELPEPEDWSAFGGRDLDAKLAELSVIQRRIEASIVGATEHAERTAHYLADGHRTVAS